MTLKQKIMKFLIEHSDGLNQALNSTAKGERFENEEMSSACRTAASEGIVLLKNTGVLPLKKEKETAFFGRVQCDYFYMGYGSGGNVFSPYKISPINAICSKNAAVNKVLAESYKKWCDANPPFNGIWGMWPASIPEMPITKEQAAKAACTGNTAVVFIGRGMGECMDNKLKEGWYFLTKDERALLDCVTDAFHNTVVVINAGNIIDLGWLGDYGDKIGAVLYAFHGGMESGNAVADVLYGDVCPGGKLAETIAHAYKDYPSSENFGKAGFNFYREDIYVGYRYFETFAKERVLFPFGYGLSYTEFSIQTTFRSEGGNCIIDAVITNTGTVSGTETVQIYVEPPQGKLGKPARSLVAFQKTQILAPGEKQVIQLKIDPINFASYDDSGVTGYPYCYVLEEGVYTIYAGTDVRSAVTTGSWQANRLIVVKELSSQAGAVKKFKRMRPGIDKQGRFIPVYEDTPICTGNRKDRILNYLPSEIPMTGDKGITFSSVCEGDKTPEEFVAQLNIQELDAITRGEGEMNSSFGIAGNAGMFGGTIQSLRDKGIPTIITTDGPSGIRASCYASMFPCAAAMACTWNPELIQKLGALVGEEMAMRGVNVLLGPGMNILRSPLCGRNFEYYSEDPLISGKIAAAMVRGIQSNQGRSACPKHLACNNQERMRWINDARVSERALREIYLKGFEICINESKPMIIMTSYNKVNGVWSHYNYALVTEILRNEWGYDGLVITDWWMRPSADPDFPNVKNNAYRVRAQVDVLMPGSASQAKKAGDDSIEKSFNACNGITLGELQRSALNVIKLCMKLN